MTHSQRHSAARRTLRVPPALHHEPGRSESIEGIAILAEVQGDGGLLLWQTYRDVLLWASAPPVSRSKLFAPEARERRERLLQASGLTGTPCDAAELISDVLHGGAENMLATGQVTAACHAIAQWAASQDAADTAVAFARAAAEVSPNAGAAALRVGILAARFGRLALARSWFRRAVTLSRQERDWISYGFAFVELGHLALKRDSVDEARQLFRRAYLVGERYGSRVLRGHALHGRSKVAVAVGDFQTAKKSAEAALRALGKHHPDAPLIQHSLAELLLRLGGEGSSGAALHILAEVLPTRHTPGERIATLSLLIRAAMSLEARQVVENAWFDAISIIDALPQTVEAARLYMILAHLADEIISPVRADGAARRALVAAMRADAGAVEDEVKAFLARPRNSR